MEQDKAALTKSSRISLQKYLISSEFEAELKVDKSYRYRKSRAHSLLN